MSDAEEKNEALVRRFFEARVKTDQDTLEEMLAPDFVSHTAAPMRNIVPNLARCVGWPKPLE